MDSFSRASIIQDLERGKHDQYSIDRTVFREEEYDSDSIPSVSDLQRTIPSTLGWWKEEYIYCAVCLAAAAGLIALLSRYDGELEPHFGGDDGLQLSTVIIAIMTAYRVALSAIVETALSQGAWIWVSAARQNRKKKTEPARLEDFKMFDEASRGLVGCLSLIWRLRGTHLACVGAGIIILIHGFETFSQQMVTFEETPTPQLTNTSSFAPSPARSETWHNVILKGVGGDLDLGLSTKASFYDGIMASSISDLPASCGTANCTWQTFPSLAVRGNCASAEPRKDCPDNQPCTFTMSSGTSVTAPSGGSTGLHFTVAPLMNTSAAATQSQAYISTFDVLSVSKGRTEMTAEAWQCAMWFCLNSYDVSVTNGRQNTTAVGTWSRIEFSAATSAHDDEFHFIDIPENMQANARTRYSVPLESIEVLQGFMASKMIGNYSNIDNFPDYSSDWIQAMQNSTSDMPTLMSRLTLSMTNDIRMSGTLDPVNGNQYEYVGAAYTQRPFVRVNWYWVIYPVVLMILAFLYLIQTVWRTARDHVSAWKGDSLPMLFAHIDKGIHQVVANGMDVPGGLTDRIGRTQIELIRRQNGKWLFKLPQRAVRRREATAASE